MTIIEGRTEEMKRLFRKLFRKKVEPKFSEEEKKVLESVLTKINEQERMKG